MGNETKAIVEKELKGMPGMLMLFVNLILEIFGCLVVIGGVFFATDGVVTTLAVLGGGTIAVIAFIFFFGLHIVNPNEALVLTLFGKYYGTIKKPGFFFVNPFATAFNPSLEKEVHTEANGSTSVKVVGNKKISTKVNTLENEKQKVNDVLGNPIIIGAVVIWKVADPTKAVFAVENFKSYLSTQTDSTVRNTARLYPYDDLEEKDGIEEKTLRGSSQEIAEKMKEELQERVSVAGLEIIEVRITHLSYSEEIAAAMLQRQQATAIIAARQKIVEGAVSMVEMAINQLNENDIVVLDEERKAQMVSNLLVVLCGNKDAQPVVNSGSIY